ncbi:MAG: NADH-quinone oxidoreductase subunit L [Burkholderiales bacterium]|nr:NADH-quinone oxidoreductase subunit L [Burkholderiales bacterium]
MDSLTLLLMLSALIPVATMALAACWPWLSKTAHEAGLWKPFHLLTGIGLGGAVLALGLHAVVPGTDASAISVPGLISTPLTAVMAVLVQWLGWVIAVFSARYLQGDLQGLAGQRRYVAALGGVLTSVQVLLLADHWLVLIAAWASVGLCLRHLLCFYGDRPFALLASHKKRLADRLADALLLLAAGLAWSAVGSGSLSELDRQLAQGAPSAAVQASAVALVLAVILRTALFPVHGWLIQVMEAPTPVSALLHAGVVNLGGLVLIRFAPLLESAPVARWLLVGFGLGTALLAGLVMLTRISIKVRLAWSTVAQMGFMVLECGLGLYTLAALHLIGHSLYKAQAFLSASGAVQQTRLQQLRGSAAPTLLSQVVAPVVAAGLVGMIQMGVTGPTWPWWWSGVLALAWAPLLWGPASKAEARAPWVRTASGLLMVVDLTLVASWAHLLPLGLQDAPEQAAGMVACLGMAVMYACLVTLQQRPQALSAWRRWSYAGFYVDEVYTRVTLWLWPTQWAPAAHTARDRLVVDSEPAVVSE